jgi:hypothetical protein
VGPLSEITHAFDHLLIQLAIIGLKVKVLRCKLWSPLGISPSIKILQVCTLVTNGLCILGVLVGFQDFTTHFLDEVLFQDVTHINNLILLEDTHVALGILSSCVACWPFYFTWTIPPSLFMSLLASFDKRIMQVCGDIMGPRSWEFFQGPLMRHQTWLLISFNGIGFQFMEDYAPSIFLESQALMALYFLYTRFGRVCFSSWKGPTLASIMLMCDMRWPSSYN